MDLLTRRTMLTLMLGIASLGAVVVHGRDEAKDPQVLRVLFIGNGYTEDHDLPDMVRRLAATDDPAVEIEVERLTERGATLQRHRIKGLAERRIREGGFHVVVLQEQSMLPLANPGMIAEEVGHFAELIRECGARPVLMTTWAPARATQLADRIAGAYADVSRSTGVQLAPVGSAWSTVHARFDEPLYPDEGVPGRSGEAGAVGAYLSACVLYESVTGHDCRRLGSLGMIDVPPRTAARLQAVAHETVEALDPTLRGRR